MEVTIRDLSKLDGAAWIAKQAAFGLLRLERSGDELRIIGTNNYVLVDCYEMDCEFADWPDGEGVQLRGEAVMKAVRRIAEKGHGGIARPLTVRFEKGAGENDIIILSRPPFGFMTKTTTLSVDDRKPLSASVEKLKDVQDGEDLGTVLVSGNILFQIGKLARKLRYAEWRLVLHGSGKLFELRERTGKNRIYAMPMKG